MLRRAKSICFSKNLFFNEVNKLKFFFLSNNHPAPFFDNVLKHFLNADTDMLKKNWMRISGQYAFFECLTSIKNQGVL